MAELEAVRVSRWFRQTDTQYLALAECSVDVQAGDFLVISGPSGSGKSTLLNLLSSLDSPSSGEVRYCGQSLSQMSPRDLAHLRNRNFGFIFQTPHLLRDRTVLENVELPYLYGECKNRGEIRERCVLLLDYVGLADVSERFPDTLSGGEMQRVVFARALACRPKVIFADEPTGSLDDRNSLIILDFLKQQTARDCAVVMATHDATAMTYGTKFLALRKTSSSDF